MKLSWIKSLSCQWEIVVLGEFRLLKKMREYQGRDVQSFTRFLSEHWTGHILECRPTSWCPRPVGAHGTLRVHAGSHVSITCPFCPGVETRNWACINSEEGNGNQWVGKAGLKRGCEMGPKHRNKQELVGIWLWRESAFKINCLGSYSCFFLF